jgi:hypothetical protein
MIVNESVRTDEPAVQEWLEAEDADAFAEMAVLTDMLDANNYFGGAAW